MKFEEAPLQHRDISNYKVSSQINLTQSSSENRQATPDSLDIHENGNQTISSGYESSECGSTSNVHLSDKNVPECNHNTVLTEENLSRFMQQVDHIRMDSRSDCQLSESYSNSLIEIKNHNLRSGSDSDRLSFGTVSSCADLTYSDDDEGLSSTSCELPLSPRSHLYPHGIINPNYPGFQHLAHTLSEEYSTHGSNCNLSDCSVYQSNMRIDMKNANESSEDDNGNPNIINSEYHEDLASPISDSIISANKEFSNYDHQTHVEQCNLQTYLNHYRNKSDVKLFDEEMESQQNLHISCTPPDILFYSKGYDLEIDNNVSGKPDLIQNVREYAGDSCDKTQEQDEFCEQVNHDMNDEKISLPPNIVGDFEKEIEKEIVEIVSGYKDIFGDRTTNQYPHTTTPVKEEEEASSQIKPTPITAYNKIHDAQLSNGREAITPSFDLKYIKLPSMMTTPVKSTQLKQMRQITEDNFSNMNKKYQQHNNNLLQQQYKVGLTPLDTTTKTITQNHSVNLINNNNNVHYVQEQAQQVIVDKETKHHYNCNFFNAISKNVNRKNKTTSSSFFKTKEWNSNEKTVIKTKDDCGIISIEAPSSLFDFSIIEHKLNSVVRENKEKDDKKRIKHHEEIRRRLQMVEENGTLKSLLNKGKANRPSLQSRLQNGKNLQICFMNENISDGESPSSDSESCPKLSDKSKKMDYGERHKISVINEDENDFFTHQAKLQIEARMALAQAKDMAHLQMELEKQKTQCPVTQIIHNALHHASIQMPEGKRRVSRQLLTEFTVPQLRIIVDELNGNIEKLNEHLVKILMERDELHMGQDSMLVDIEDLTRYLAAKEAPLARSDERLSDKKLKSMTAEPSMKVENGNGASSRFFRLSSFGKNH